MERWSPGWLPWDKLLSDETLLVGAFARNKFLDAVVVDLYDIEIASGVDINRMGVVEITRTPAIHAPMGDKLSVEVELGKSVTSPGDQPQSAVSHDQKMARIGNIRPLVMIRSILASPSFSGAVGCAIAGSVQARNVAKQRNDVWNMICMAPPISLISLVALVKANLHQIAWREKEPVSS
jgi:hypothetical protein